MKLTLTYADLIAAASARLQSMGITGEITGVELKTARKDITASSMVVYVGEEAPAKKPAATKAATVTEEVKTEVVEQTDSPATSSTSTGRLFGGVGS